MQTTAKLLERVDQMLEEDEHVKASAFALQGFSDRTERWLLVLGLYVIGSLLIIVFSDRVFVVLTNKRLLILELSPKYLFLIDVVELPVDLARNVQRYESGFYSCVACSIAHQFFRWRFPKHSLNFTANRQNASAIAERLSDIAANVDPRQAALEQEVLAIVQQSKRRTSSQGWLLTIALSMPLCLVAMIATAVGAGTVVGDFREASTTVVLVTSAVTFCLVPTVVMILVRQCVVRFLCKAKT